MIPILDEQEKYDSPVVNFYLLIGSRMGSRMKVPIFFSLSLHVHFSTPFNRIASQPFPLSQFPFPNLVSL